MTFFFAFDGSRKILKRDFTSLKIAFKAVFGGANIRILLLKNDFRRSDPHLEDLA